MLPVERLDDRDDVNRVDGAGAGVGEDRDQNVLLDVERARVERELPRTSSEEDAIRDSGGHEAAERHDGDLRGDGGDRERLLAVPEELVEEGEEGAGESSEEPHTEGEHREGGVVGGGNGERHLRNRGVFIGVDLRGN